MSSVAIMQPYIFPYLGYYQLVYHCDKFVFYDDVNYIKSGYINRNNILVNGAKHLITFPVLQASSFSKINALMFSVNIKKQLRTLEQAYSRAPFFKQVFPIVNEVLTDKNRSVSHVTSQSILRIFDYLGIPKDFYLASELNYDRSLGPAQKLYEICDLLECNQYCNTAGGQKLYSKEAFSLQDIELSFIQMADINYSQNNHEFISNLSMIDVLMWNSKKQIVKLLTMYRLI